LKLVNVKNISRPDGRPEGYDLRAGSATCIFCQFDGHASALPRGKVVMMPPHLFGDDKPHFVCIEKHVPDDIVIFDPETGKCRDKSGENEWKE
jgi:hypothetical protein